MAQSNLTTEHIPLGNGGNLTLLLYVLIRIILHVYYNKGWLERVVSLESLLETINCLSNIDLRVNYTKKWDEAKKAQIRLGIL